MLVLCPPGLGKFAASSSLQPSCAHCFKAIGVGFGGVWVQGLGVWGQGFRVCLQGFGLRVWGLESWAWAWGLGGKASTKQAVSRCLDVYWTCRDDTEQSLRLPGLLLEELKARYRIVALYDGHKNLVNKVVSLHR